MKFAYADPPYLGCGALYAKHHPQARDWDDVATHRELIGRLVDEYPDGWAMSLSSPSLRTILPMCPDDCRVAAWVKPFAIYKPNGGAVYAWEPVIFRGGRRVARGEPMRRDWVSESTAFNRGLIGGKPLRFVRWVIALLNAKDGDIFDDIFPGTGIFDVVWSKGARPLPAPLFDGI